MGKSATRLLTLMVCAAVSVISIATSVNAATSGGVEIEKSKRKVQNKPAGEPRSASPAWPPPMYDDFDRKNAGGGGGM